jgi:hypothetical protein
MCFRSTILWSSEAILATVERKLAVGASSLELHPAPDVLLSSPLADPAQGASEQTQVPARWSCCEDHDR